MINKVKKCLLRHDEINIYKKNCSGSEYYRVGNSIIRVSDHITVSNNQPDVLNIVVSGDNFVVMHGNKIINVNDYNELKTFLKYHIKMCNCFKDIINSGLKRKSHDYIFKEAKKKTKKCTSSETALIKVSTDDPRLEGLSAKQINSLITLSFKNEENALSRINSYRKQKGLPEVK